MQASIDPKCLEIFVFTAGKEQASVPCGCSSLQDGGIAQEAYIIENLVSESNRRKIPIVLTELTRTTSDVSQEVLLNKYAKLVGFDVLSLSHGWTKGTSPIHWLNGSLQVQSQGVGLEFRAEGADVFLPIRLPISGRGLTAIVNLPRIKRGQVVTAYLVREGTGLFLDLASQNTTSKDPVAADVAALVKAHYDEEATAAKRADAKAPDEHTDSKLCMTCHPSAYASWLRTRHAIAMVTLESRNKLIPECIRCHQVQDRLTPSDINTVECTACHKRALPHLASPSDHRLTKVGVADTCLVCHTRTTDPQFVFQKRLSSIIHGGTH